MPTRPSTQRDYRERINRVIFFIEGRLDEKLELNPQEKERWSMEAEIRKVEEQPVLFVRRTGPYEDIQKTYDRIFKDWLPARNEELRDEPGFEVYLNAPGQVSPAELKTEIWIPLG